MYNVVGALVIVATIIALFVMQWKGRVTVGSIAALGVIGIAGGLAIPNLTVVRRFEMTAQGINADIVRQTAETVTVKAEEVHKVAEEVRNIEQRVESLAKGVETTTNQVKASEKKIGTLLQETDRTRDTVADMGGKTVAALAKAKAVEKHVTEMQGNMQQTWRSLLESSALAMGTRNIFPPPPNIGSDIDKHLNILATFAYPDANERNREITRIMGMIKAAQAQPIQGQKE